MRNVIVATLLAAALSGCSLASQLGGLDAGKCIGAQLAANNPVQLAPATTAPASGEITFSAPAGTRFALCAW